jgi:ABC-type branched-subunit amino acid transport system substrate-binding protein
MTEILHGGAAPAGTNVLRRLGRLAAVLCSFAVAGCGGISLNGGGGTSDTGLGNGQAVTENQVAEIKAGGGGAKVALLLPLSAEGQAAIYARSLKQAAELALFDTNNPSIVLIPKDTRGTPGGAQAAAQEAVRDGAELILGPLFATEVKAVAPIARAANVPVIAFSSDRTVAGNGVLLLSFLPDQEVARVVSYAAGRGKKKFGALLPGSPYGQLVEQAMTASVPRQGGKIVEVERFAPSSSGLDEPVRRIAAAAKEGRIETLMIGEGGDLLKAIIPMLASAGVDRSQVQLVGTGLWDEPGVGSTPGLEGGWFAGPSPKAEEAFARRYKSAYGVEPPRIASLAYDAVSLAVALGRGAPGERFTLTQLTNPEGFAGVDGLFRFLENGGNQRGLAVMEITPTGNRVIDPAPARFSGAGL